MLLSEIEKNQITKKLKKFNKKIWKDEIILQVVNNIEKIKNGQINKKDYFIPGIMTYEDYLWQLNLIKFV